MDVDNITSLRGVFPLSNNQRVRVLTLLQEFWYDVASVAPDDGITVVKPNLDPGRWIRDVAPVPVWTAKTVWHQDSVTGDDENAGDATTPVKTLRELTRRLRRVDAAVYTIHQMGSVGKHDSVRFAPELSDRGGNVALPFAQTVATILITGQDAKSLTPFSKLGPGTTNTDPKTNTQATVADSTASWATHVGKFIRVRDAKGRIAQAVVLKVLASGVARVSEWVDPMTGAPALTVPVAGDPYQIVTLPDFAAEILYAGLPSKVELSFKEIRVRLGMQSSAAAKQKCYRAVAALHGLMGDSHEFR